MTHSEEDPESQRSPDILPETAFVRALAKIVLEDAENTPSNPLTGYEPGQPLIIEAADQPAFIDYLRARVSIARRVNALSQSLPEDVRSGGRVLLDILTGVEAQAMHVADGNFKEAHPIPCPENTDLDKFAAALLIVARHTNMDITGTYWGTHIIASPGMTVSAVTDNFFDHLNYPK